MDLEFGHVYLFSCEGVNIQVKAHVQVHLFSKLANIDVCMHVSERGVNRGFFCVSAKGM